MPRTLIISPEQVGRILKRLAAEVIERNRGAADVEIFGIRDRGTALASALAALMGEAEGRRFEVSRLDVTRFRDDRPPSDRPQDGSDIRVDVADRDVLLVDDVLFTGRTARAALDAVVQHGRPRSIQLIVLVDRGHREYPIQPDFVGRIIPTKHRERVVLGVDGGFSVCIEE